MSEYVDLAAEMFGTGFNCAESVLMAVCRGRQVQTTVAPATAFGGGIGRTGLVCGALTGAIMALGVCADASCPDADRQRRASLAVEAADLVRWFEGRAGSVLCGEIIGFVPGEPGGSERFKAEGLREGVCLGLVRDTVKRVLEG